MPLRLLDSTTTARGLALSALISLAACSGAGTVPAARGTTGIQPAAATRGASDTTSDTATPGETAMGMPGETAMGMPGETAMGMPGETAMGMPGETAMGMPGGQFACTGVPAGGSASCTMTINVNVAPNPNPNLAPALIAGLHPADLQSAYALPASSAGGTVAIVDANDAPGAEADLAVYRAAFGLPPCTTANGCFRKVDQRGGTSYPAPDAGWAEETALDLDMVSAVCPNCKIVLVEADSALLDDLGAAVDTAASLGARAISNSYYAVEWSSETSEDAHYRHPGVAITASSGDRGYPAYPAVSQYVTSVGGTSLSRSASGGWSEANWKYTGAGCSRYVAKPAWQGTARCKSTRSAVDVSAVADPQTGVSTFNAQAGGWLVAGGTSVGAPLIAAAYVLSGNPAGPSYSYARPRAFRPVGASSYNLANGLGSPLGVSGL